MEKETDLKQSEPVVLFNVDRRDRLVDYAVCHNDYECGEYLLRQAELALGGAYVPNESVFCLAVAERTDDGLPELLDDYIRKGDIRELPSFDLRSLTFIHETTGGGLPEGMWTILEKTEQLLDDPDTRKALEAYHGYHERRENALPERTVSAVRTDKGVLLFDDSGRGLQCLESYLQYHADRYFFPELHGLEKLETYHFSTSDKGISDTAGRCASMFALQGRHEFVPQKAHYLPDSLVAGLRPSAGCPMHADGEAFRRFVKTFGLNATDEANEIAALIEIRARGVSDPGQLEKVSVHPAGFHSLYQRRQACLKRNDIVMYRALGQASKDMADRILRTEYKVREYAPAIQGKGPEPENRRKTGKTKGFKSVYDPPAGEKTINRQRKTNGTFKRRI